MKHHLEPPELESTASGEAQIRPSPLQEHTRLWPWMGNFQDSDQEWREERKDIDCVTSLLLVCPHLPTCIPYVLSEACFPFLLQSSHPIFPAGFFSSPGQLWSRIQIPNFSLLLLWPQPLALMS